VSRYFCGIDIGGTFTDCVVVDEAGRVVTCKVPSTPGNFAEGMLQAVDRAAERMGLSPDALCKSLALLSHGTTTGTNAVIQKRGARVGLLTTKGHNDVIHIMRGSRGLDGRDIRLVVHFPESQKPDPLVPKRLIRGISERVDCFGNEIVELNEDEVRCAAVELRDAGVEAIAICYLWSFLEPSHEARTREIVEEVAPELYVSCSHELVPKWGEYERTTATALNTYIGPATSHYLAAIDEELRGKGYSAPLQITQCAGGTISVAKACQAPLLTLDSGPVSGVMGSKFLGDLCGYPNIITTDMGGTSFDVGIIYEGRPASSYRSIVNQYEYYLPKVDIQAIGSGGGSQVWIDEVTGSMRVGPESAGADPGPVCYGRGGGVPTVTDADLVLGYLDGDNFAGGTMRLDRDAAAGALEPIAKRLGLSLFECASGIAQIAEFQMADLIRKVTIQKGFDPRDFALFAFGGAGPVHAAVFARELGIDRVVIPQGETASVWCAFGAVASDILHVDERVEITRSPFDPARISALLAELRARGAAQLERDGVARERQRFAFSVDMRHRGQINEVEIELAGETVGADELPALERAFVGRYELLYGKGASLPGAALEMVTFRVRASAALPKPVLSEQTLSGEAPDVSATRPPRAIYWAELGASAESAIFDGGALLPGNRVTGPAVIETEATSVVVHPGQECRVDRYGNFELDVA
jgi:N-methylhydantoinase A